MTYDLEAHADISDVTDPTHTQSKVRRRDRIKEEEYYLGTNTSRDAMSKHGRDGGRKSTPLKITKL